MIKIQLVILQIFKLDKFKVIIIGKIKAISTSKIRKMIAIKKNRIEKGIREVLKGLNPHSNGDIFSRSKINFLESKEEINITIKEIIKNNNLKSSKLKIIYIN